jgi:membrane protease YdiL (CAAX protease family)
MTELPGPSPSGYRPVAAYPAGWYADPWIAGGMRYWDGWAWTGRVAAKVKPPKPPHQQLPLSVALTTVATLLAALVVSRYLIEWLARYRWPIVVYVALSAIVGYGPSLLVGMWASRRCGTGSLRADSGLYFRRIDIGWGFVTWLVCLATQAFIAFLVLSLDIPFISNTEGINDLPADRGYILSLLVVAVLVAPVVEEMLFRGLLFRGLLSRMGVALAVAVQAVLFGLAHFDPSRGTGNIGLIMVLSGVGAVLGGAEFFIRRIGPTIIAHFIINAIAMSLTLLMAA